MIPVLTDAPHGRFRVWEPPKDKGEYVVGVDVAEGRVRDKTMAARRKLNSYSDEKADYSAIAVVEVETAQHIASWRGSCDPFDLVPIVVAIGAYYNWAHIVPELNGPGIAVVKGLVNMEYPSIYQSKLMNFINTDGTQDQFGWRTTVQSRPILINALHQAVATKLPFTCDQATIGEMRTMEFDDQGTARGRGRNKDDRVMALALALVGRVELLQTLPSERTRPTYITRPEDRSIWAGLQAKEAERRATRTDRRDVHPVRPLRRLRPGYR